MRRERLIDGLKLKSSMIGARPRYYVINVRRLPLMGPQTDLRSKLVLSCRSKGKKSMKKKDRVPSLFVLDHNSNLTAFALVHNCALRGFIVQQALSDYPIPSNDLPFTRSSRIEPRILDASFLINLRADCSCPFRILWKPPRPRQRKTILYFYYHGII